MILGWREFDSFLVKAVFMLCTASTDPSCLGDYISLGADSRVLHRS